jgi:hypothetical protein
MAVQLINVPEDIVSVLTTDHLRTSYAWGMEIVPKQTRYVKLGYNSRVIAADATIDGQDEP